MQMEGSRGRPHAFRLQSSSGERPQLARRFGAVDVPRAAHKARQMCAEPSHGGHGGHVVQWIRSVLGLPHHLRVSRQHIYSRTILF